ncbi:MAG: translation initiation factor IF-2 [Gammaproteobacteria bacterium]|nr:translation initiation factor IF-2 [Gammaproteobacteria bacterium]
MADVTVKQLAEVIRMPVDELLIQLGQAGMSFSKDDDVISNDEKMELLAHLRQSHGKLDDKEASTKKVTLNRSKRSTLKVASAPTGRGRGSGATTRTVNVVVRKKRTYVSRSAVEEEARLKTEEEDRIKAEEDAKIQAVEDAKIKAEEDAKAKVQAEEDAKVKAEDDAKAKIKAAEDASRQQTADAQRIAEQEAKANTDKQPPRKANATPEKDQRKPGRGKAGGADNKARKGRYGRAELHVATDKSGRRRKGAKRKRTVSIQSSDEHGFAKPTQPMVQEVNIPESITVSELAQKMSIKAAEVIKVLMNMGTMATINQNLDQETAELVVDELGHKSVLVSDNEIENRLLEELSEVEGELLSRAPVVTVMGHVDHGKTSLLDYIRSTKVADGESGGITQHVGAYHVETSKGNITFLDTPGHAAFTSMRARGAQLTDIVILVVAADDGVMPQTIEAIKHAKAGEVPLIIAVNKIDREAADPERVKNELSQHDVIPEDWGGDAIFVNVSAKTGEGVDNLLEAISLQAEMMELTAVEECPANGIVIESSLDRGRGPVATILIRNGILKRGDVILTGSEYGRVRAMFDEDGNVIDQAGPVTPVVVLGLSGVPHAGNEMHVVENERKAREIAVFRKDKDRDQKLAHQQQARLEDAFSTMSSGKVEALNLVIKADVQGSMEALRESLNKLSTDEVRVNIVAGGVGGINESDVGLALASRAIMLGFNVRADATSRKLIEENDIDLHYYSVIYDVIDEVKKALSGMLSPEVREEIVGLAEVKDVFRSSKFGTIAGSMVIEGSIRRSLPIRVLRDDVVIYEGELESLRRHKDDVNEVRSGTECGIGVKNYTDVHVGDQIEVFERTEVARTID